MDATTGTTVDTTSPPAVCDNNPGVRERAWPFAGGGYSILFPRPDFQATLPAGSSYVGSSVGDRKSTRLNSSHVEISYAVFCLKKKKQWPGLDYAASDTH